MDLQTHTSRRPAGVDRERCSIVSRKVSRVALRSCGALLALFLAAMSGCRATPPSTGLSDLEALSLEEIHEDQPEKSPPADLQQPSPKQPDLVWHDELASDTWVRTVGKQAEETTRRWRHEGLEQLLALADSPQATLAAALSAEDPVISTNAAIGLARLEDVRGLDSLAAAVDNRDLPPRERQAAAEALGEIEDPRATDLVVPLLDTYGRFDEPHRAAYNPDLHAELLRSLKVWQPRQVVDEFQAALAAPGPEVRLVALQAWTMHPDIPLPERVEALREDRSPQVRAAALTALAAHRVEHVERLLESGLTDDDLRVSLAAIAGLGTVATKTSAERLRRVLRDEPEVFRAAAVEALAQMGDFEVLSLAADDASWRVRLQAAQQLCHFATLDGTELARRLLNDSSTEVQRAVVAAVADWPLATAGDVLLDAMSSQTYRTRNKAADLLVGRWPAAGDFIADESTARRTEALSLLRTQWRNEFGVTAGSPAPKRLDQIVSAENTENLDIAIQPSELQRVQVILHQLNELQIPPGKQDRLLAELGQQGPTLPAILEHLNVEQGAIV